MSEDSALPEASSPRFSGQPEGTGRNALRRERRRRRLEIAKEVRKSTRKARKAEKKARRRAAFADSSCPRAVENDKGFFLVDSAFASLRPSPIRICIDCDFEHLQDDRDLHSLCQQLMYAYGEANKANVAKRGKRKTHDRLERPNAGNEEEATKFEAPVEIAIAGVGPRLRPMIERLQCGGKWKCLVTEADFNSLDFSSATAALKPENSQPPEEETSGDSQPQRAAGSAPAKCIYLTADAEEEMQSFEGGVVYVIGGLVDRNKHKGVCLAKAKERNIKVLKLPLREGGLLRGSKVLTVNQVSPAFAGPGGGTASAGNFHSHSASVFALRSQVVSILIGFASTGKWEAAFTKGLPQRKAALDAPPLGADDDEDALTTNVLLDSL